MGDYEVLAARLSDEARKRTVARYVLADLPPHPIEGRGGAREMDAGEVRMRQRRLADLGPGPVDEVDDSGRKARGLKELHEVVRGVSLRQRRLPHHGIAQQRRARGEVPGNGREVERGHGEDEPFEGAVVHV